MAGKYNQWVRKTLAARIRSNGGYYARHGGELALSWAVPFYLDGFSTVDEAKDTLVEQGHFVNLTDLNLSYPDFDEAFASLPEYALWQWAQERMVEDLSSDEGMRTWAPATASRYGFAYEGLGAEHPFDMSFELWGRGGKHVCLGRFEGVRLYGTEDICAVLESTVEDIPRYSNLWCRQLMGMLDELDACLTRENAARCGQYYAADFLMQYIQGDWQ